MDSKDRRKRLKELDQVLDALTALGWDCISWRPVDEEQEAFRVEVVLRWQGLEQHKEVI